MSLLTLGKKKDQQCQLLVFPLYGAEEETRTLTA
jgi:hypothetical protein